MNQERPEVLVRALALVRANRHLMVKQQSGLNRSNIDEHWSLEVNDERSYSSIAGDWGFHPVYDLNPFGSSFLS